MDPGSQLFIRLTVIRMALTTRISPEDITRALKNLKLLIPKIDRIILYDNTSAFRKVAIYSKGVLLNKESNIPEWLEKYILSDNRYCVCLKIAFMEMTTVAISVPKEMKKYLSEEDSVLRNAMLLYPYIHNNTNFFWPGNGDIRNT